MAVHKFTSKALAEDGLNDVDMKRVLYNKHEKLVLKLYRVPYKCPTKCPNKRFREQYQGH